MVAGAESRQKVEITCFLVENCSEHKNSIAGCVNCAPADTVARATADLAAFERRMGDARAAIRLLEHLLAIRSDEISYWVQAEIYQSLGRMYLESGVTPEARARFSNICHKFSEARNITNRWSAGSMHSKSFTG